MGLFLNFLEIGEYDFQERKGIVPTRSIVDFRKKILLKFRGGGTAGGVAGGAIYDISSKVIKNWVTSFRV